VLSANRFRLVFTTTHQGSAEGGEAKRSKLGQQQRHEDPTRPLAVKLSPEGLRRLLIVLMRTPADTVAQVGHLLMLFEAIVRTNLPVDGATAAWKASRLTPRMIAEERQQDTEFIARHVQKSRAKSVKREVKDSQAAKVSGGGDEKKQAKPLQGWAVKRHRNVIPTLELLQSGASHLGETDASLLQPYVKAISLDKAARVSDKHAEPFCDWFGELVPARNYETICRQGLIFPRGCPQFYAEIMSYILLFCSVRECPERLTCLHAR